MGLEQGADPRQIRGIAEHDSMRIADVDRGELDLFDVLARSDTHLAHVGLVEPVADAAHLDEPRADVHAGNPGAGAIHQPGGGDACSVARHLRERAVGIDDRDGHVVAVDRKHAHDPVEIGLHDVLVGLSDEVDVPVGVPARRCHRQSRPAGDRHRP